MEITGAIAGPWRRAYELWLENKSPNTRRAYQRAWTDVLAFSGKHPARLLSADIQAWVDHLAGRPLDPTILRGLVHKGSRPSQDRRGLSPSTIGQYLAAVSSFYQYVSTQHLVPAEGGGERPLHRHNPAAAVARPSNAFRCAATYLDAQQLAALLRAIPRWTVQGLRDYALLLGYVLTGRRNSEWRCLQWGQLGGRGARIFYRWQGKGSEEAKHELPPPVWEAIRDYLDAVPGRDGKSRLATMKPADYVFTPLTDSALRLPNVDPAAWNPNRALSAGQVNGVLKKYGKKAGLDPRRLHVHVLRHSAAMLEEELGTNLSHICKFLGHRNPSTTMRYLDRLRGQPERTWEEKARLLQLGHPPTGARHR